MAVFIYSTEEEQSLKKNKATTSMTLVDGVKIADINRPSLFLKGLIART